MTRISEADFAALKRRDKTAAPVAPRGKRRGEANKLEMAFYAEWLRGRDGIENPLYEAMTFRFYDGSETERPAVWTADWTWWETEHCDNFDPEVDFIKLCACEVKGSREMKNARASIRGVKACATRFPQIRFFIAERIDGCWRVHEL